jgi:hypothetical protein
MFLFSREPRYEVVRYIASFMVNFHIACELFPVKGFDNSLIKFIYIYILYISLISK